MKQLLKFSRRSHLWLASLIMLPVVIILVSGILLQVRKEVDWVQPPTQRGSSGVPQIAMQQILQISKKQGVGVIDWQDIYRLDIRPGRGIVKVLTRDNWELQLDLADGKVLHKAYRRSGIIEDIHQGSWFHKQARLWLFLPVALCLLWLWISGSHMLLHTMKNKLKYRWRLRQKANKTPR